MSSPEFNITVGLANGDAVQVSVFGALDPDSVGRLRAVLNGILRAGHRKVVVDFARSDAVDGNTRDLLARMLKRVRSQAGEMVVHGAPAIPAPDPPGGPAASA